jgi:photosystem II stability/assembly factor-like uncharacterized protein
LLTPVLVITTLFIGCGTTPPEPFWEPDAADSAAIRATALARRNLFTTALAELSMQYISTDLPGTTQTLLDDDLVGNPFKQRFRADSMEHVFQPYELRHTLIAGLNLDSLMRIDSAGDTSWVLPNSETTCTVTFVETIPGKVRFHAYAMTKYLRDTGITTVNNYRTGYAAGPSGRMLKTTDAGATWSQVATGVSADLNSVDFPLDYLHGYAAGNGGLVLRTDDAGATWQTGTTGTSENLNSVVFSNTRLKGFAVGDNGTLLKTRDFGVSWTALNSGTTANLHSVAFMLNQRTGIAVGDNGTVIRTTNDSIWTAESSGTSERLNAVAMLGNNTTVYAVGDNGTILKSTDAGVEWAAQTSGTTQHLRGAAFPAPGVAYAVGDYGTILKSTDLGQTWVAKTSNTSASLRVITFPENMANGWAFGADGTVLVTRSAGDTWTPAATGYALSSAWFGAARDTQVVLPYYDSVFTHTDSFSPPMLSDSHYVEKTFTATTVNGCVLKKQDGEWSFWKMAGGGVFYAPNPQDAPYIVRIHTSGSHGTDTIFMRPDTLHFGMQGLYEVDSLPTFQTGDSLRFSGGFSTLGEDDKAAAIYLYLVRDSLVAADDSIVRLYHRRIEFERGRNLIRFDSLIPPGLYRLYFEQFPPAVLWDRVGTYSGTVWGIPLLVK